MSDRDLHEWVNHEHTRRVRKRFEEEAAQALVDLKASARKSSDPDVARDAANLAALERFVVHLSGGDFVKEQP
jgi:hypothetical protein